MATCDTYYFPVWNTDQSAILLRKNNPRASCEIWHLTLQLALGAIFPAFFCRLWASVNQPCDMIGGLKRTWRFERRSGWAKSAGNEPVVRWQNGLWNGLALFLSIGTERNKFRTNGPKWKIVHLTGPNWTDGNLGCKGRAKNSEIPNSSSKGSSRIAFLWYSFILRYTCQLSRLRRESHACGLKTSISRPLTPVDQFLTPDWKMWVVAVLLDTISKNMLTQTHVRNENHV